MANSEKYSALLYSFLILVFLIPILFKAKKNKLLHNFTLEHFVLTLNSATILQIFVAIAILTLAFIFDKAFYENGNGNYVSDFYMNAVFSYVFVGLFIYLPLIGLFNLFRLTKSKK
jgi:hypothetical protein